MERRVAAEVWQAFLDEAQQQGFVQVGAAPKHRPDCEGRVREWVRKEMHADMQWYARGLEKRFELDLVLEGAASVLVLITPYESQPCSLGGKKLARYACGDDYHDVLKKKLWHLIEGLQAAHPEASFRPYVDTGPLLERYWAAQAGLGWVGKNGNLISRRWGSYVFLACIVTDLVVPYGQPHDTFCGRCRACIDACPTDAIVADGMVDSRRCISYLNIEHRGAFEQAPAFEDWLFGCDICQEVCPWTHKFSGAVTLDAFLPRPEYATVTDSEILTMEQEAFSSLFSKSPVKRTRLAGLVRNMTHLQQAIQPQNES